ncbi:TcdA/TcdB pore forming domain-containing protein [Cercophora samala]|uniref:TcdA/TcdB pore forming domain-containing protein n=1 Tax=Cercophora samala TaxID=330535 RepID=A0AA40D8J9_9PEZI|nr:TcdA/TcdB pore forming domain-containing protein [Cercophora samala]
MRSADLQKCIRYKRYHISFVSSSDKFDHSSLCSLLSGMDTTTAEDIALLRDDPQAFLQSIPLDSTKLVQSLFESRTPESGIPETGFVRLIRYELTRQPGGYGYSLEYAGSSGFDTIPAYFLGYNGSRDLCAPAFIDIHHGTDRQFVFTGELSGCSVVVTQLPNGNGYRVFHDFRVDSSVIHENVVMAVDARDYVTPEHCLATSLMHFRDEPNSGPDSHGGSWHLLTQKLEVEPAVPRTHQRAVRSRCLGQSPVISSRVCSSPEAYQHSYRGGLGPLQHVQKRRQAMATQLYAIAAANDITIRTRQDGPFELFDSAPNYGSELSATNPAVRETWVLREGIRTWIEELKRNWERATGRIKLRFQNWKGGLDVSQLVPSQLNAQQDPNSMRHHHIESLLDEMRSIDRIYLWLLLKEQLGIEKVIKTDANLMAAVEQGEMTRERQARLWESTDNVVATLSSHGADVKAMPQDILVWAANVEEGGFCYALVRAMAVALWKDVRGTGGGLPSTEQVFTNMLLSTAGEEMDGELRNGLKELRVSPEAVRASELARVVTIHEAVEIITSSAISSQPGRFFALNTQEHAMLVGVSRSAHGQLQYHFFDPNFALATFQALDGFRSALLEHFQIYSQMNNALNMVEIRPDAMAKVPIGSGMTVNDLSEPSPPSEYLVRRRQQRQSVQMVYQQQAVPEVQSGRQLLDVLSLAQRVQEILPTGDSDSGLDQRWVPILQSVEDEANGGFRVQFVNMECPDDSRWISFPTGEKEEFERFRCHLDDILEPLVNRSRKEGPHDASNTRRAQRAHDGILSAEPPDGLNWMFIVQAFVDTSKKKVSQPPEPGTGDGASSPLIMSIKIQHYLNLSQMAHGVIMDGVKVGGLLKSLISSELVAEKTVLCGVGKVTKYLGVANEMLGTAFGVANVGLDIYNLCHAGGDMESQQAIFATHLACDSVSLTAGTGATVAGIAGFGTTAGFLGALAVPLAGLGIGAGALAEAYGQVARDAQAVGAYFANVHGAYTSGGYQLVFNSSSGSGQNPQSYLKPLPGAVISHIDLGNNTVTFDSQYIYATTRQGAISWVSDCPHPDTNRARAINVRQGIGIQSNRATLPGTSSAMALILPCTPKSYISYSYTNLIGADCRHDRGFDIARRLERTGRFEFNPHYFCMPFIMRTCSHEYVDTPVSVFLGPEPIRLEMPALSNEMANHLKYSIQGAGGSCTIGLQSGASLQLETVPNSRATEWVLDARGLSNSEIQVTPANRQTRTATIKISDLTVEMLLQNHDFESQTVSDAAPSVAVTVLASDGDVMQVDLCSGSVTAVEVDAKKWPSSGSGLAEHLEDLQRQHRLHGSYVCLQNYTASDGGSLRPVGCAYFEVAQQRMLYTKEVPLSLCQAAALAAVVGDDVYFAVPEQQALWRVDAKTGECRAKYCPFGGNLPGGKIRQVVTHGSGIHVTYAHQLSDQSREACEITYEVEGDSMSCISISGDDTLFQRLQSMTQLEHGLESILPSSAAVHALKDVPGVNIFAGSSSGGIVSVTGKLSSSQSRLWIELTDGSIIQPNLQAAPDQLLVGYKHVTDASESYLYSRAQHMVYQRVGNRTATEVAIPIPPELSHVSSVSHHGAGIYARTTSGYSLRLYPQEKLSQAEAFDISGRLASPWWEELVAVFPANHPPIALFGMLSEAQDHPLVPAWYQHGRVIVAAHELTASGSPVRLLGFASTGAFAWLAVGSDSNSWSLYRQPAIALANLATHLKREPLGLLPVDAAPLAVPVTDWHDFVVAEPMEDGLLCRRADGVIYLIPEQVPSTAKLVGVTSEWAQKKRQEGSLDLSLDQLAETSKSRCSSTDEVIEVHNQAGPSSVSWYLTTSKVLRGPVASSDITPEASLVCLGAGPDSSVIVLEKVSGTLYQLEQNNTEDMGCVSLAKRRGDALYLAVPYDKRLTFPMLHSARHAVVSLAQATHVEISPESWKHYNAFFLSAPTRRVDPPSVSIFTGSESHLSSLIFFKIRDDLAIADTVTGTTMTVTDAMKTEKSHRISLTLRFQLGDVSNQKVSFWFSIADITSMMYRMAAWLGLSGSDVFPVVPFSFMAAVLKLGDRQLKSLGL